MRRHSYRYVLQIDDDAFLTEPIPYNIVTIMDSGCFKMGAREIKEDDASVMWGIAELSKYFIISENFMPTLLYNHCTPHDITGVYSRSVAACETCNAVISM